MSNKFKIESICDDPFGSKLARAMDKLDLSTINTIQERRIDISLATNDLAAPIFFNRITADERTLYASQFDYATDNQMEFLETRYSESR